MMFIFLLIECVPGEQTVFSLAPCLGGTNISRFRRGTAYSGRTPCNLLCLLLRQLRDNPLRTCNSPPLWRSLVVLLSILQPLSCALLDDSVPSARATPETEVSLFVTVRFRPARNRNDLQLGLCEGWHHPQESIMIDSLFSTILPTITPVVIGCQFSEELPRYGVSLAYIFIFAWYVVFALSVSRRCLSSNQACAFLLIKPMPFLVR